MVFLNLLIKPLSLFGIDATVQNRVGPEEYGLYFSLLNLSVILNILLDLGINNFTTKRIAQRPEIAKRYFGRIFSFRFLLFFVYFFATLALALLLNYSSRAIYLLCILGINQFFIISTAYCRSHFAGFHFFKIDAFISILDRFLLIIIGGFVLFSPNSKWTMSIEIFLWIQFICYLSTFFVAMFLLYRHIDKPLFKWDIPFSFSFIKRSVPYALLIVLMLLYTRLDGVMLERIHPNCAFESGIFAQGFRLLDALYMFGMIFAGLLFPMFSKQLKTDTTSIKPLLKTAGNLLIGGAILIVVIAVFNSYFLLHLIYVKVNEAIPSFQWLMFGFLAICMNFLFGTLLTANGSMKILNITSALGIVVNFSLNLILIPKYGASGAAFASFITQSFTALIQFIYCLRVFNLTISIKTISSYAGFVALLILFSYWWLNSSYLLLFQLILGVLLMFLFSFIDFRNLKELLVKNESLK
jgi:O-antigen/teichoic acid export membrane protein